MKISDNKRFYELYLNSILSYPKAGIVETTTRCNLKCLECARNVQNIPSEDMDYETFEKLDDLLKKLETVHLFGHGETFLNPNFERMFLKAKSYNTKVSITTNATILNERRSRFLVDNGIDEIIFSIDAASKELFETIRRGANYEVVLSNIKFFCDYAKKSGKSISTKLQMVAMLKNIDEIPELVNLASILGIDGVCVIALAEHENIKEESIRRASEKGKEIIEKALSIAKNKKVTLSITDPSLLEPENDNSRLTMKCSFLQRGKYIVRDFFSKPISAINNDFILKSKRKNAILDKIRFKRCLDPFEFIFVTVTGEVRICCVSPQIIGDFRFQTLDEIWFGNKLADFRNKFLSDNPPNECKTCINRSWDEYDNITDFIIMGENDEFSCQRSTGWFDTEIIENKKIRWCDERGIVLLKNTGKKKMMIEFYNPFIKMKQNVEIFLNGNKISTVMIESAGFIQKKIDLPRNIKGKFICFEFYPDKLIKPLEIDNSSNDSRKLGVAISSVMLM